MAALTSVLIKPCAVLKDLPQYAGFSEAATGRVLKLISKACKSSLQPLLKTTEAKTLLAMMAHKGPGLVFVKDSPLGEVDKNLLQTADKQCANFAKAVPAWLHQTLPESMGCKCKKIFRIFLPFYRILSQKKTEKTHSYNYNNYNYMTL